MKKFLQHIACLVAVVLTLSACESDVEFRGEYTDPQMVVYSVVTAGEPVKVFVSRSSFVLEDENHSEVRGAEVEVWVNGALTERLAEVEDEDPRVGGTRHYYTGTTTCRSGDRVEIKVASAQFEGTASGETTIPEEPLMGDLQATIESVSEDGVFVDGMLYCELSDPADQTNYYWLTGALSDTEHPMIDWVTYTDIAFGGGTTDGVLGDIVGDEYREYVLFDDALIDGKERYPLTMEWDINESYLTHTQFRVECWQVDEHLYKYFRSIEQSSDGAMFGEPVQIHSNINGGVGLVASRSSSALRTLPASEVKR